MIDAPLLDCGHPESPHSEISSGYATDLEGKRMCYDCSTARDLARMRDTGEIAAYLSCNGRAIINWPGRQLLTVVREWETSAGGFARGTKITRVWARDEAGLLWHGRGPGRGMYMRLKRSKDARRQVAA